MSRLGSWRFGGASLLVSPKPNHYTTHLSNFILISFLYEKLRVEGLSILKAGAVDPKSKIQNLKHAQSHCQVGN
ncbi:MAG TPA: hypothetical protein DCY88_35070 [Cyanobacteria bacterium UBA11372]|nr:hypothetical protein [Cyanobacteria bacterium UBA11372]